MDELDGRRRTRLTNFSQFSWASFPLRRNSCKSILWLLGGIVKRRMGQANRAIDPSPISHYLVKDALAC